MLLWTLLVLGTLGTLPCLAVTSGGVDCDQSLTGASGVLSSYNFPFDYRHNLTCTYRVVLGASTGPRTICFRFKRFALERSTPFCSFDYLKFENTKYCVDGNWQWGRQPDKPLSNVWNKHFCWPAKNNHFDVTFSSDNNLNGAGFYADYHVLPGLPPSLTDNIVDKGHAPCAEHQWTCFNRRCVNLTTLCDGRDDCGDNTDESYAHARCPAKSVLSCDFSTDRVPSDGQCGFVQQDGQWFRTNKALSYGPRADHTNGTEGYFMYTDSDHSPAYLVSPELTLPPRNDNYCISFWYYVYGRPAAAVLRVFLGRVVTYNRPEWERANAEPNQWLRGDISIRADQPLQVTFGAVLDNSFSGVALDDISVTPGPCHGGDVSCSFESTLCGWRSVQEVGGLHGNLTWERTNRLQSAAGPMEDHSSTDGSGLYVLVRAPKTHSPTHPRALLLSPPISALSSSSPRCLRFWYHLTGSAEESAVLKVRLVLPGGELAAARWAQNARFRNSWRQMALQLSEDKPYQVLVEAILDGASGQVALDQIVLEEHACPEVDAGACAGGEFLCGDGSCVPALHRCDGVSHCADGSDEDWRAACPKTTTVTPTTACPKDYFQCVSDGRCVPMSWVCDNFLDCADSSDESHLAKCEGVSPRPSDGSSSVSPCGAGQFTCSDGECVQAITRCDGKRQCDDGSDEVNCTLLTGDAAPGEACFRCAIGSECVRRELVCDGQAHCPDGSDEDSTIAHCARRLETAGLGTASAVALALCLVVALTVIILPVVLCRRRKARQQRGERNPGARPDTPDTATPDISTISYGDDTSLSRPLEDSLRRACSLTSSYRPGRRDAGRVVNPVNEFQRHIDQMDDRRRQSCIENLERYMINPRRTHPLPAVPAGRTTHHSGRREDDLVDPNEYILALRAAPSVSSVLHPPPYSIRDYQNLQCTYVPPDGSRSGSEGADAPSSSGVYSLPPDEPPPPYDGPKEEPLVTSSSRTLPLRTSGRARAGTHTLPALHHQNTQGPDTGQVSPVQSQSLHSPTPPGSTISGITPYHVSLVHRVPENPSLTNSLSAEQSSMNNNLAVNHSIPMRYSPSSPVSSSQLVGNSASSLSSSRHSPSNQNLMSPHHVPKSTSPTYHSNPGFSPTHSHNNSFSSQPPRTTSPRHNQPIYPRLGTLQVSRSTTPQHHPSSPPTSPHGNAAQQNPTPHHGNYHNPQHKNYHNTSHHNTPHHNTPHHNTPHHNTQHTNNNPHNNASHHHSNSHSSNHSNTSHHAPHNNNTPHLTPHNTANPHNTSHHKHQQQQQHPQRNALPASHQLQQVQLQFLPSSSV